MTPHLENPAYAAPFEPDVLEMIGRLADRLDQAVDPRGDSKAVVSEALMRLATAVYMDARGAVETRDRLMTLALSVAAPATLH